MASLASTIKFGVSQVVNDALRDGARGCVCLNYKLLPTVGVCLVKRDTMLSNMLGSDPHNIVFQKVAGAPFHLDGVPAPLYGLWARRRAAAPPNVPDFEPDELLLALTDGAVSVRCHLHLFWDARDRDLMFETYARSAPERRARAPARPHATPRCTLSAVRARAGRRAAGPASRTWSTWLRCRSSSL
jgi:hypothetical protein